MGLFYAYYKYKMNIKQKIKYNKIKEFREEALIHQGHRCALCHQIIDNETTNDAVLDHSHSSGSIRGVLHRHCNSYLGKLENSLKRYKISDEQLKVILENAYDYIKIETDYIHPTHGKPKRRKKKLVTK